MKMILMHYQVEYCVHVYEDVLFSTKILSIVSRLDLLARFPFWLSGCTGELVQPPSVELKPSTHLIQER